MYWWHCNPVWIYWWHCKYLQHQERIKRWVMGLKMFEHVINLRWRNLVLSTSYEEHSKWRTSEQSRTKYIEPPCCSTRVHLASGAYQIAITCGCCAQRCIETTSTRASLPLGQGRKRIASIKAPAKGRKSCTCNNSTESLLLNWGKSVRPHSSSMFWCQQHILVAYTAALWLLS